MRRKVILNPWANRGRAIELKDSIIDWFAGYGDVDVALTTARDTRLDWRQKLSRMGMI